MKDNANNNLTEQFIKNYRQHIVDDGFSKQVMSRLSPCQEDTSTINTLSVSSFKRGRLQTHILGIICFALALWLLDKTNSWNSVIDTLQAIRLYLSKFDAVTMCLWPIKQLNIASNDILTILQNPVNVVIVFMTLFVYTTICVYHLYKDL